VHDFVNPSCLRGSIFFPRTKRLGENGRSGLAASPLTTEKIFLKKKKQKDFYLLAALLAVQPAYAQPVGATSYTNLPFVTQIYRPCWNCTAGLDPKQLFYNANPRSPFLDKNLMARVHAVAAAQSLHGIIPTAGLQRWEDTYEASFPAGTFPKEPAWIKQDRAQNDFPAQPEFAAWRNFIASHPQYADIAFDGGTMPNQPGYFRAWGGQWGYISPLTPLDPADCPPEKPAPCSWGDQFAHRWAQITRLTYGYGLQLSDFTDGQPYQSTLHDFNPRITAAFAKTGIRVPAGPPARQSAWINAHAFSAWTDFLAEGYAAFYAAMLDDTRAATGHAPLMIGQCNISPARKRTEGVDERILARRLNPDNFMCIWDDQVIQLGRAGPIANPPIGELAGFLLAAAREPLIRNGANLEADDAAYWAAIAHFLPGLSAADQQELGLKYLKRLYAWSAWAQIIDRDGKPRRALAFLSRDYWDSGSIARLGPIATLIHTIIPAAPFGPALYYPVSVERQVETEAAASLPPGGVPQTYLMPPVLQSFLDAGAPVGVYVSDAALPKLEAANAPSAWVVLGADGKLPPAELAQLRHLAPVVTSARALRGLPNQPLLVPDGLTGFGFMAADNRTIIVLSNPGAESKGGALRIAVKSPGAYGVSELQSRTTRTLTATNGILSAPVQITRWDTLIFAVSQNPPPN
jgi:hypothetical protein